MALRFHIALNNSIQHSNARTDNKHTTPVTIVNIANQLNYLFINILPLVEVSLDSNLETRYKDL